MANRDDGEFHVESGYLPWEKLFPVFFTINGNRAGMVLHMSYARWGASGDQIRVAEILMIDGRGCGSRENLQSLMGSHERWVVKNFSR